LHKADILFRGTGHFPDYEKRSIFWQKKVAWKKKVKVMFKLCPGSLDWPTVLQNCCRLTRESHLRCFNPHALQIMMIKSRSPSHATTVGDRLVIIIDSRQRGRVPDPSRNRGGRVLARVRVRATVRNTAELAASGPDSESPDSAQKAWKNL
jgi:hypothetical protein